MNMSHEQSIMQMQYKAVIVDDEPMAVKAIDRIITRNCPEYQITGTAGNGQQALELIRKTKPDLVLTDITMPVMNGLELVSILKNEFPDMCFVIISGYQDFEYMRSAIQSGVLDYLAKPIMPSQIVAMMERVREKLRTQFYQKRNSFLRSICLGEEIVEEELEKYYPYEHYYAALLRENGLPRRFFRSGEPEIFGSIDEAYCVYGRDSMEELFLIPAHFMMGQSIDSYMKKISRRQKAADSYSTLLYYGDAFERGQMKQKVRELYHALNALSTVGLNQSVDLDKIETLQGKNKSMDTEDVEGLLQDMDGLVKSQRYDLIKDRIGQMLQHWVKQGHTQLWLENAARRILGFVRMQSKEDTSLLESEYHLEDAFYYATSTTMLCDNLYSVFYRLQEEQKEKPKVDSLEFFDSVRAYLEKNLTQPLSLQSLCDEFAISQAYMSKLFRKYANQSYTQYLTGLRMERAKILLRENRELFVKDVAAMVGYMDQFYFSRIFRSYTGKSPADYLKSE